MPKRLKSCKNAGAAQTLTRDVLHWRTRLHFFKNIVWRWILKIKSMHILSHSFTFKTLQTLVPHKTVFQETVRGEPCLQCVCTWLRWSKELTFKPSPSWTRRKTINREKIKELSMLPVIVKIHEYTLVMAIILLAQWQNYDNLRRFMCTHKILLE